MYAKCQELENPGEGLTGFAAALTSAFGLNAQMTGNAGTAFDGLDDYGTLIAGGFDHSMYETAPKAYLNVLLFDRDHHFVDAVYSQIGPDDEQGENLSIKDPHGYLSIEKLVTIPGYAYIFLSNENPTQVDVYFDDLKVTHAKSPVVQMDDYYPFGLTFNSYQRENSLDQRYLYNGKELQDELSLSWFDYGARMYDPAIGRRMAIDPLSDISRRWSPYNYAVNNPIRFVDPDGMYSVDHERERNKDNNWKDDMGSELDPSFFERGKRQCICAGNNGVSESGPDDDWQLNKDGTLTLIKQTDDNFNRYYNENGELIYQTNWTKDDVGNEIASSDSDTPAQDFMSNLYTLLRAFGDKDMNGGSIAKMYERAGAVGWDSNDLTRLIVESETAYRKDLTDFTKSFLDVRSLGRGKVPLTAPISEGFKFFTGQPISNFLPWLRTYLARPRPGFDFDWNNPKHNSRLMKR